MSASRHTVDFGFMHQPLKPAPSTKTTITRKEYLVSRVQKQIKEQKLVTFCCLVVIPVAANIVANLVTHLIMNFHTIVQSIEKIIF